jgi:hypothetical protein
MLILTVATFMAVVVLVLAAGPAFAPECIDGDCNPIQRPK